MGRKAELKDGKNGRWRGEENKLWGRRRNNTESRWKETKKMGRTERRGEQFFYFLQKNPGHLVRWNYISDAHAVLMLLSHQHIAQTEMLYVCVHVCGWSLRALKVRFLTLTFLSRTPYLYWASICITQHGLCGIHAHKCLFKLCLVRGGTTWY